MNCPDCNNLMYLKFNSDNGTSFWSCSKYPNCRKTQDFIPKFPNLFKIKGMGWYISEKLKELNGQDKIDLLNDIHGQMLEILKHYVWCRVGGCYSSIYRFLLIDFLDDNKVLEYFLKSDSIKYGPDPIIISVKGAKIFYDLFYDLMLVKSDKVKQYLLTEFPEYYSKFQNKVRPDQQFNFIDYKTNSLINDSE